MDTIHVAKETTLKVQIADHLLFCNHSASHDNCSTLTYFLLELKESLLIMI